LFDKKWIAWLGIFAALIVIGGGAGWLLGAQGATQTGNIIWLVCAIAAYLWVLFGLIRTRKHRLSRQTLAVILSGTVAVVIVFVLQRYRYDGAAVVIIGTWSMGAGFVLGLALIRGLLIGGHPIIAVARTLIDEAIRMKIALIFIVLLIVLVPLVAVALDPEEQLRYRLQFFLTWGLGLASFFLSMLTVFVACWTITREISTKEIFITMTKPISRAQFLLGKWLGICLLNLLLVMLAGGTVLVLAKMLQAQPANDAADRVAVDQQLMIARVALAPQPPESLNIKQQVEQLLEPLQVEDPQQWGEPGTPLNRIPMARQVDLRNRVLNDWRTIGPLDSQVFLFAGIDVDRVERFSTATDFPQFLQLHIEPNMSNRPSDGIARIALWVNDRPFPMTRDGRHLPTEAIVRQRNVVDIPLSLVSDEGAMAIRIANVDLRNPQMTHPSSMTFEPGEDMEMFYPAGRFAPNLVRTMVILWVRLAFLAVLGLLAGTFLGFPVACLFAFTVYGVALASGYLDFSLSFYAGMQWNDQSLPQILLLLLERLFGSIRAGEGGEAFKTLVRIFGETAINFVPAFSEYNPVPLVSDGRLVPLAMTGKAVLMIGVVWGGGTAVIAWMIFRRRELARITL
jgi:hypothetical protein